MFADPSRNGRDISRDWATLWLVAIVMLASTAPVAWAQQSVWVTETQSDAGWIITLGGYGDLEPKFEGARHHTFWFHPIIDFRAVGSREWLSLPNDGFDFPLIVTDSFRAGPVVNGRWERDVSSLVRGFRHVSTIELSAEAGVFAEWWPAGFLRTRVEARDAVFGASGIVADLSADAVCGQRIDGSSQLAPASLLQIEPSCGATIPSMRSNPSPQVCRLIPRRQA